MKVAVFSGTIPSTTFVEHLINGLSQNGVEVLIFGKKMGNYKPKNQNVKLYPSPRSNVFVVFFVIHQIIKLFFKDISSFTKIPDILSSSKKKSLSDTVIFLARILPMLSNKPDVFHIQWVKAIEDYFWVKSVLGIKLVVSLRGAHINYSPLADPTLAKSFNKFFPMVDFFHAVSEAISKEGNKYGMIEDKSMVIKPAVQRSLLDFPLKIKNNLPALSILSVGRFHWKKGYHYALDAMAILLEKDVNFFYTIVAGGEHEEILFQISSLGLKDKVTIINGLPHNEVLQKISEADLFLLPSVEEGIANVVLESMAIGTPVITTDCGGMIEVVENYKNGFIVPVRDPEAIVDAIQEYKSLKKQEVEDLQKNARETIIKEHLVENQINSFQKLYEKALSRNN
ncbi:hypothetical protein BH23BAC1_BH23BAC1_15610 [soil metagenome]